MYRILVIDDEPHIVDILERFLIHEGFDVGKAYEGKVALEIVKGKRPDLIILDEKMPGMGGAIFIKELKKLKEDIPVVVLTGSIGASQFNNTKKVKYKYLLYKPIRLMELLEVINGIIRPVDRPRADRLTG